MPIPGIAEIDIGYVGPEESPCLRMLPEHGLHLYPNAAMRTHFGIAPLSVSV